VLPSGNAFRRPSALCCLVGLAIIPARVSANPPTLNVDCPAMTPEQRASVEARSRAELAILGVTEGEIAIRCWPPLAIVQYAPDNEPSRSGSRHLVGETDAWIEQILSIVHDLFARKAESKVSAVQSPGPQSPRDRTESTPQPPAEPQKVDAPAPITSQWKTEAPKAEPLVTQASVGACAEVWAKPLDILPGVCAWFGLRSSFSRIALVGGVQWAAARVQDITIRHWQGGLEWSLGHPLWFAVSGQLSVFQLTPNTDLSPTSRNTYDPSVTLRGGTSLPVGGQHLQAGAGIRLQPGHEVHIDGRTVFSVPIAALTLDLAYEFEL